MLPDCLLMKESNIVDNEEPHIHILKLYVCERMYKRYVTCEVYNS